MSIEEEIWAAIRAANAAWMRGDPGAVASLFAEDVVLVAHASGAKVEGRGAVVQSYVDYCREVRTHAFRELDHTVDVRGEVAVATYRFAVRYEVGGSIFDELGQEVLVLALREGRWQAIWRTQIPLGSPPDGG